MTARSLEVDRIRDSFSTVLEGNIRMNALKAKQEARLQALKGGLSRPELASQAWPSRMQYSDGSHHLDVSLWYHCGTYWYELVCLFW